MLITIISNVMLGVPRMLSHLAKELHLGWREPKSVGKAVMPGIVLSFKKGGMCSQLLVVVITERSCNIGDIERSILRSRGDGSVL